MHVKLRVAKFIKNCIIGARTRAKVFGIEDAERRVKSLVADFVAVDIEVDIKVLGQER